MIHRIQWTFALLAACALAGCAAGNSGARRGVPTGPLSRPLHEEYDVLNSDPTPVEGFAIVTGLRGTGGAGMPAGLPQNIVGEIGKRLADLKMSRSDLDRRDNAIVRLSGIAPPFSPRGSLIDVTVTALNDGTTSLQGGIVQVGWMKTFLDSPTEGGGTTRHYSFDTIVVSNAPLTLQPPGVPDPAFRPDPRTAYIPAGGFLKEIGFDPVLEAIGRPSIENLPEEVGQRAPDAIELPVERTRISHMNDTDAYRHVSGLSGSRFKKLALVTERAILRRFGRGTVEIGDKRNGYFVSIELPPGGYTYYWSRFINVLGQIKPSDLIDGGASEVPRAIELLKTGSPEQQGEAALRLEAIGQAAVPALMELAREGTGDVNLGAASILATMRDEAALPYLMRYVPHGTLSQRLTVAMILPFLGSTATDPLRQVLNDDNGLVRYYALFGLNTLLVSLPNHQHASPTDAGGRMLYYLDHVEQPGRTMVVIKTVIPRRLAVFGPDPSLRSNIRVEQGPFVLTTNEAGMAFLRLDIGRYDDAIRPLGRVTLMSLISKLHNYGVSINDIVAIVQKLVDNNHIPVRADDLYWVEQRT